MKTGFRAAKRGDLGRVCPQRAEPRLNREVLAFRGALRTDAPYLFANRRSGPDAPYLAPTWARGGPTGQSSIFNFSAVILLPMILLTACRSPDSHFTSVGQPGPAAFAPVTPDLTPGKGPTLSTVTL